ncbi:MAG: hypothetical protein A2015_04810 [Spirochaetes bacterium GWF1_31_7]|nr:MAG: hypothetical protein A2Y30_05190 [Spirochaetes bacterium GWE1_32_154]OHD48788.1 MAG: hypothetical protein A2Y29_03170 [Spirochaetes bacterium GWE2_31_10]OHD52851.1 MAG: hypothetical protein A2015_04810 [Spirochaetes bacterium GWF1_31_7]HBD93137.1 hypothetical protein [Spirochaetia bacterium]HBI37533.1 hypothetical protein [Spirochaetia bacterium]
MKIKHICAGGQKDSLLIFFCGFALHPDSFTFLKTGKSDVLFIYHYQSVHYEKIEEIAADYNELKVTGYSFGCFIAAHFIETASNLIRNRIKKYTIINGTYVPLSKQYGIPEKIFELTVKNIESNGIRGFFTNIFDNENDKNRFLQTAEQPYRTYCEELVFFKHLFQTIQLKNVVPDIAIISTNDRIFSMKNQLSYWSFQNVKIQHVDTGHFPFYSFQSWDEL